MYSRYPIEPTKTLRFFVLQLRNQACEKLVYAAGEVYSYLIMFQDPCFRCALSRLFCVISDGQHRRSFRGADSIAVWRQAAEEKKSLDRVFLHKTVYRNLDFASLAVCKYECLFLNLRHILEGQCFVDIMPGPVASTVIFILGRFRWVATYSVCVSRLSWKKSGRVQAFVRRFDAGSGGELNFDIFPKIETSQSK